MSAILVARSAVVILLYEFSEQGWLAVLLPHSQLTRTYTIRKVGDHTFIIILNVVTI